MRGTTTLLRVSSSALDDAALIMELGAACVACGVEGIGRTFCCIALRIPKSPYGATAPCDLYAVR